LEGVGCVNIADPHFIGSLRFDSNAILLPSGEMLALPVQPMRRLACALAFEILADQAARYLYWLFVARRQGDGRRRRRSQGGVAAQLKFEEVSDPEILGLELDRG
jgi:hypothetical protein